jgi:hypothetical protein
MGALMFEYYVGHSLLSCVYLIHKVFLPLGLSLCPGSIPGATSLGTIAELLERNSSGSGLENRDYSRRDPPRSPCGTLSICKSWH